ncbi:hypothetical protein PVAP13_3NG151726 [Panicum virgatum]|uniref:Uncharacterized protein n=1 Tax=Panicum virgatum TaxID=38727 RepID=A0A8T0UKC2_PANVG|nr:hypothetical protein PVAP13_3NG151726 [Panicum virgatum]
MPVISAAFQKVTKNKFPRFGNWDRASLICQSKLDPMIACFSCEKYMGFWDGDRLNIDINPFKGMIYRIELMHYCIFHALNQAELPDELDVYRLGGRKIVLE